MGNKNYKLLFSTAVFIALLGIFAFSTNIYGVELLPFPQRPQTQQQTPESADDRIFLNRIDALACPDLFALREGVEKICSSTPDPRDKNYYLNYLRMINNVIAAKRCSSK
jgi:hypothetical protein